MSEKESFSPQTPAKIKLHPHPGLIHYPSPEGLVTYNPLYKDEYILQPEYFERLQFWNGQNEDFLTPIDEELLEGNLVCEAPWDLYPWKGDKVAFSFHLATRNHESMTPHLSEAEMIESFTALSRSKGDPMTRPQSAHVIKYCPLPEPKPALIQDVSLFKALKERKTSRDFDGTPISLEKLSTLLYITFGHIHGEKWDELSDLGVNFSSERKSSPSGSGLQACEAYLSVSHVEGLEPGFYRYCSQDHTLALLSPGCDDEMQSYLVCDQFWVKGAACGLFITVDMERMWHKCDFARAYAYIFLEAGHISQNTLLTATALGMRTWLSGSMRDSFVADKFQLDGYRSFPVTSVYFGNGSDEAVPRKIKELALMKKKAV